MAKLVQTRDGKKRRGRSGGRNKRVNIHFVLSDLYVAGIGIISAIGQIDLQK
jgi:hypothetical protein